MSEIYKNSTQHVYLDIHGSVASTDPTAACISPGHEHEQSLTVQGPEEIDGAQRWTAIVGLPHTQNVGPLDVVWNFSVNGSAIEKVDNFEVVKPLVSLGTVREELELDEDDYSDAQIFRAERRARRIIENFTSQKFHTTTETNVVHSNTGQYLRMPNRLLSISEISSGGVSFPIEDVRIQDDGWRLAKFQPYFPGVIVAGGVPIIDPYDQANALWRHGTPIYITGTWGWERIPSEIQEAALILIEQQLCDDAVYRERYIKTMTAADWRIEFTPGAYAGTGNVVADQILSTFISNRMAVI